MKKHALLLTALCVLSACGERTNPLLKADQNKIASWLYENRAQFGKDKNLVDICGEVWRTNAKGGIQIGCDDTFAPKLATLMSTAGFGSIEPADVQLATIWVAYTDLVKIKKRNQIGKRGKRVCKRRATSGLIKGNCLE